MNDFHGNIAEGNRFKGRAIGGAAVLGAYLKHERESFPGETFIVHAGDIVGASPPQSALLQDEPVIMMFNELARNGTGGNTKERGYAVIGVPGNHEFDEGLGEFRRLIEGGNHERGPFLADPYPGAEFPYICANVVLKETKKPLLPPYLVQKVNGAGIAFIGSTLQGIPSMVMPSGVADLEFVDEVEAINAAVNDIVNQGVRAIVVVIHQGGKQEFYEGTTRDSASPVTGPIVDIVRGLHKEVDVVIAGHTHNFTNALLPNAGDELVLVTQAFSGGNAFGDIELTIDGKTGDVSAKTARIVPAWGDTALDVERDRRIAEIVQSAREKVAPLVERRVGIANEYLSREANESGESALGNLIADAQRAAMNADIAFMNPGGIRADLDSGEITWGELYTIQPFNNHLVKMNLSGKELRDVLEQQWIDQPYPRILQVSGISVWWTDSRPSGERVLRLLDSNGVPIIPSKEYAVVVNSYLAEGGDNFRVFTKGTNRTTGPLDLDALISYIEKDRTGLYYGENKGRIIRR